MSTRIIIDSASDLTEDFKKRVSIVPLIINFGEEEYFDGVTIDHKTFYRKLTETKIFPTTSQASPDAFIREFEKVKDAGDEAVVITVSSSFSGTYQSALIAASEYDKIYVVDSTSVAMGSGILVQLALKYADEGLNAEKIAEKLNREKTRIKIVALVDTLEYLKRGGRISKTVAFTGTLLNIKPVISITDGKINILGKARGSKAGNNLLIKEIENSGGIDFDMPVLLGYSGESDELLMQYINDSKHIWEGKLDFPEYTSLGSAIGTHAGPGAVVVAYFEQNLKNGV